MLKRERPTLVGRSLVLLSFYHRRHTLKPLLLCGCLGQTGECVPYPAESGFIT